MGSEFVGGIDMADRIVPMLVAAMMFAVSIAVGDLLLVKVFNIRLPNGLAWLTALFLGIGSLGIATVLAVVVFGVSPTGLRLTWGALVAGSASWAVRRWRGPRHSTTDPPLLRHRWVLAIVGAVFVFHALAFIAAGFSYPLGSDTFVYLHIPQTLLRAGRYVIPGLEPLGEAMPFFITPALFEVLHVNSIGLGGLVTTSMLAKAVFVFACLLIWRVGAAMTSWTGGAVALALFLVEPFLLYFFYESGDNYFVAIGFQILAMYCLFRYHAERDHRNLLLGGVFLGLMLAAKQTTVYYFVSAIVLFPLLALAVARERQPGDAGRQDVRRQVLRDSTVFAVPAVLLAAVFPLLVLVLAGALPYGMGPVAGPLGLEPYSGWYEEFVRIFLARPYLRYPAEFVATPYLAPVLAPIRDALRSYWTNPLELTLGAAVSQMSHAPTSLLVTCAVFPLVTWLGARQRPFYTWAGAWLWLAYLLMLFTYPFLKPPKSQVFQFIPAFLVFAGAYWSLARERVGAGVLVALAPLMLINAYRIYPEYRSVVVNSVVKSRQVIAASHRQAWYNENLTGQDVLFGRLPNECTYIEKPACVPFWWQAMYFVDWEVIERRLTDLNVTVIYDSSQPPDVEFPQGRMPLIERKDPALAQEVKDSERRYRANYAKKVEFLARAYTVATNDSYGTIYRRKDANAR